MRIPDARYDLVDGLERRLPQRVDISGRDSSEVDRAPHAVVDMVGFLEPLVRLQKCAGRVTAIRR